MRLRTIVAALVASIIVRIIVTGRRKSSWNISWAWCARSQRRCSTLHIWKDRFQRGSMRISWYGIRSRKSRERKYHTAIAFKPCISSIGRSSLGKSMRHSCEVDSSLPLTNRFLLRKMDTSSTARITILTIIINRPCYSIRCRLEASWSRSTALSVECMSQRNHARTHKLM